MQYSSPLLSIILSLLLASSQASSVIQSRQAAPRQFKLQTKVIPGINDCGTDKNGLLVFSYHTGAGVGVAAAASSVAGGSFYLSGTTLWAMNNYTNSPWPVALEYTNYASFNEISISIAGPSATPGFFINATGLQQNTTSGWLACDWWFQDPLVLWQDRFENYTLPASCSYVNLIPIPMM